MLQTRRRRNCHDAATGTLHLLPVTLGDDERCGRAAAKARARSPHRLDHFIVENEKTARAFSNSMPHPRPLSTAIIAMLDKDTPAGANRRDCSQPLLQGADAALMSEAGCPAVADPGALLVRAAHRCGIRVVPHVGPSAILLALMASGFNGQRSLFTVICRSTADSARSKIRELERESRARTT